MLESSIRIATVFRDQTFSTIRPVDMAAVRWLRISEALAELGFEVEMIAKDPNIESTASGIPLVDIKNACWNSYHVVKTLFHSGFDALTRYQGESHPFIICKLGSVLGSSDDVDGVYFFGEERKHLYHIQQQVAKDSRYVTVLTNQSRELWGREHGNTENVLLNPTGVDTRIPKPGHNPFAGWREKVAVYIGNLYSTTQVEVNRQWQRRLNSIAAYLSKKNIRMVHIGEGDTSLLDHAHITCLGPMAHDQLWDYHFYADVGIALAQGPQQHNESSKIYNYLRAGLPVVSESPIPNNHLIASTGLGLVSSYGDDKMFAELVEAAVAARWERSSAMEYMRLHHSWENRAKLYQQIIREHFRPGDRATH